jgi:hypothetical protein
LPIFVRVRLVCGWRLGAGSRQPLASKINFVYKNGLSASRNQQVKTKRCGMPSLSRTVLQSQQAKFWCGQNFAKKN